MKPDIDHELLQKNLDHEISKSRKIWKSGKHSAESYSIDRGLKNGSLGDFAKR
jgi:hypothetical protein